MVVATSLLGGLNPELYRVTAADGADDGEERSFPESHRGRIWFSLQYEDPRESLELRVLKARNLPSRVCGSVNCCDPFVSRARRLPSAPTAPCVGGSGPRKVVPTGFLVRGRKQSWRCSCLLLSRVAVLTAGCPAGSNNATVPPGVPLELGPSPLRFFHELFVYSDHACRTSSCPICDAQEARQFASSLAA
ncbi:hypothetical protein HPB48_006838 [Haemaphysalis longicornis]|uniref:Uncharacterized protein n=1 Tax=Haemaphysalis longicornis TaxID=44386 RepID=A0A9J6FHA5_HAELO|nr:hypothetical protein HPB48_006838 [Haemaphysalis longicornis]